MNTAQYTGVTFYAEKSSARKGAAMTGTILVVSNTVRNGECSKAVAMVNAAPVATWVSPKYLATRCVKVTEGQARAMHPAIFAALASYENSPSFRLTLALEVKAAFPARLTLQPVTTRSNDGQGGATFEVKGRHWVGRHFYEQK